MNREFAPTLREYSSQTRRLFTKEFILQNFHMKFSRKFIVNLRLHDKIHPMAREIHDDIPCEYFGEIFREYDRD